MVCVCVCVWGGGGAWVACTFNNPFISASVEKISDHLLLAYWLNYFSLAESVPKAMENAQSTQWKYNTWCL